MPSTTRRQLLKSVPLVAGALFTGSAAAEPRHASALARKTKDALLWASRNPSDSLAIERAAASLDLYFAHLEETGYIAQFESLLKNSGVLDYPLSYDQSAAVARAAQERTGILLDPGWYTIQPVIWAQFQKAMNDIGVSGLNSGLVTILHQMAEKSSGNMRANDFAWGACMSLALAGLYTSVWGYMGTMGIIELAGFWEVGLAGVGLFLGVAGIVCA